MQRLVNWAVAARKFYPNKIILTTKLNVKDAFHHCHLNALIAIQTCTQLPSEGLGLMMIRLTFVGGGGTPLPFGMGIHLQNPYTISPMQFSSGG
jgi:hypothetical protein